MKPRPTLSVIMPALNEEAHLADAIDEATRAVEGRFSDWEILVFDDGSTDRTGAIADEIAAKNPRVRVTHNGSPKNLGGVYKQGVEMARFEYVVMVPGDNENPASSLVDALDAVGKAEIVLPYVDKSNRSRFRSGVSRAYVGLMNTVFGLRVRYYNGTVIHRTENVRSIRIKTDSFAYQSEALIKLLRRGKSFVEVPVVIERASSKESKAFRPKNIYGVAAALVRLMIEVHGPRLNSRPRSGEAGDVPSNVRPRSGEAGDVPSNFRPRSGGAGDVPSARSRT
jgi:glycosyltransferase involved in cell wall biosynthesis